MNCENIDQGSSLVKEILASVLEINSSLDYKINEKLKSICKELGSNSLFESLESEIINVMDNDFSSLSGNKAISSLSEQYDEYEGGNEKFITKKVDSVTNLIERERDQLKVKEIGIINPYINLLKFLRQYFFHRNLHTNIYPIFVLKNFRQYYEGKSDDFERFLDRSDVSSFEAFWILEYRHDSEEQGEEFLKKIKASCNFFMLII